MNIFKKFFAKKNHGDCIICLENMTSSIKKTKCNHRFHKKCIKNWTNEKNTCPLCRTDDPINKKLTYQQKKLLRKQQRIMRIRQQAIENINKGIDYNMKYVPRRLLPFFNDYLDIIVTIEDIDMNIEMDFINKTIGIYTALFKSNERHYISMI